ncbi:fimbrial protein [Dyella acidiphila]|uniref:Type 1 fimbrial protein n=1 Tax=Dyella acidiphila TaxID=2775866 RepID=A0ABR9G5R2_9GAMM|nr:fimbrial protein [Dyella acidiphila]MBE1159379.1 type 1 fimbrial protein [Dyella acidiphila]
MIGRNGNAQRHLRALAWLLILCASLGWAPFAAAQNCTTSSATITLPAVTVSPNASVGTLLGSPQSVTMTFTCSNIPIVTRNRVTSNTTTTIQAGETLATLASTNVPSGPGITFATNLPGIGVIITGSPTQATSESGSVNDGPNSQAGFPVGSVNAGAGKTSGTYGGTVTETFTGQLIVTGTISASSVGSISSNSLIPFWWYIPGGTVDSSSVNTGNSLNISGGSVVLQACTVQAGSANQTITLPTVNARSLTSVGSTAGLTAFNIALTCQAGANASITMTTANAATATGVIAPTTGTGFAKNVGVQILNGSQQPITFNTAQSLGATPTGTLNVPYFAQYYVTGTPVAAGQVTGTLTFTMSYQ